MSVGRQSREESKPKSGGGLLRLPEIKVLSEDESRPPGEIVAVLGRDGTYRLPVPELIRSVGPGGRDRIVLWSLWLRAVRGSVDAARAYLQHKRWEKEMRSGRAAVRAEHEHTHTIRVVDDLRAGGGASSPVQIGSGSTVRQIGPDSGPGSDDGDGGASRPVK